MINNAKKTIKRFIESVNILHIFYITVFAIFYIAYCDVTSIQKKKEKVLKKL